MSDALRHAVAPQHYDALTTQGIMWGVAVATLPGGGGGSSRHATSGASV